MIINGTEVVLDAFDEATANKIDNFKDNLKHRLEASTNTLADVKIVRGAIYDGFTDLFGAEKAEAIVGSNVPTVLVVKAYSEIMKEFIRQLEEMQGLSAELVDVTRKLEQV